MTSPSTPAPTEGQAVASFCAACGASLATGAQFCHRCGQPVGEAVPAFREAGQLASAGATGVTTEAPGNSARGTAKTPLNVAAVLPWGIAALALLAIVAAFAARTDQSADAVNPSAPFSAAEGASAAPPMTDPAAGTAPNIASLSPSERARRLYDRLMRYAAAGSTDSISFFAPMALASHGLLDAPTIDERYHYGRIAEVTGHPDVVSAQSDTMLQQQPGSLLGLVLAGRASRLAGNEAAARGFDQRLLKARDSELARSLPENQEHQAEIDRAVADARQRK